MELIAVQMLPAPTLHHFCSLAVELGPLREMGTGRFGKRRIIPIIGGRVEGPKISGTILNVGADWQTIAPDGTAKIDARLCVRDRRRCGDRDHQLRVSAMAPRR